MPTDQDQVTIIVDRLMIERAAHKQAYIDAYLAGTGYTIDQVQLVEEQIFDNALNRIVINYYLQRKL